MPFHLLTKEFYQIVKDHLAEGGVVAQNVEPSTMLFDSAVATIHSVFPQLDFYLADQNVVTIAYGGDRMDAGELKQMADKLASAVAYALRFDPNAGAAAAVRGWHEWIDRSQSQNSYRRFCAGRDLEGNRGA